MRDFNIFRDTFVTHLPRSYLFVTIMAMILLSRSAYGADSKREMSQYFRQSWSTEQGLSGVVSAIAQTPDGYLWVGTDTALYRFDGQKFQEIEGEASAIGPIHHVTALTVDAKGTLWVRAQGTHLLKYEAGVFQNAFPALPYEVDATAIGRANKEGVLLATLGEGNVRSVGSGIESLGKSWELLVVSIAQTTDGRVWLGSRGSGLFFIDDKHATPIAGKLPNNKVNCLLAADHGRLWVGTDSGLALWDGTELSKKSMPVPLDHEAILSLVQDHDGNLWVGTESGLVRFNSKGASVLENSDGARRPVTSLLEDREGNIWFGDSRGIERLRDSRFTTFSSIEGLPGDKYGPIFVDAKNRTWFAPKQGGLYWLRDGQVHKAIEDGLSSDIVYSIDGSDDDIWVGRQRGGLTHLDLRDGKTKAKTYKLGSGRNQYVIYTVHQNRDASVWAGTLTGEVIHIAGGETKTYGKYDGLAPGAISAIAEGLDGAMWFGTSAGLSVFSNTYKRNYFEQDGLPSSEITCLFEDERQILWIGTAQGLAYSSGGVIHSVSYQNPLLHERILGVAEDERKTLWIATADHVFSVASESVLSGAINSSDIRQYGFSDGLRGVGGVRRTRSLVEDWAGRIWVSTNNGLSVVDPASVSKRPPPAIAHIESVLANGKPTAENRGFQIAAGQERIAFNYTGLSFAAPETVRFRYRLDGFDKVWSEPVTERQAVYTNLAAGSYRFHVIASNNEGAWSGLEVVAPITIAPFFWQTRSFRIAGVFCFALLALLLYQLRMRQIIKRANLMFDERLAERTRIAQELHDTLLQGFFSVSMQLHVIADQVPIDLPARSQLNRILGLMGRVLDEGRDAVRGLRSTGGTPMWLEDAFTAILQDFDDEEDIKHTVTVDGTPRELRPGIQEEVCRIGREALGNVYRHAQAKHLQVKIKCSSRHLIVEVRDDGCGIDSQVISRGREGHWGLLGMRERAENIGAKLQIESRVDEGTKVVLIVPARLAFRRYSSNVVINWAIEQFRSIVSAKYKIDQSHPETLSALEKAEKD
ncbi:sensor histidine kinase [Granulicella sp. dw_53]|uniref:sensor histidine kinase n=1 Tax=Granulicella sp. dw_53 TaxID=2719792 RepID=UPI001BD4687F|nr:sensor histidine kinase [Granulicella sp. dw_53]